MLAPLRVYRRRLKHDLGISNVTRDGEGRIKWYTISIEKVIGWDLALQILMHEYAHCLSWSNGNERVSDHDSMWGVAYARVYRTVIEDGGEE